jgi:hypothetical protein
LGRISKIKEATIKLYKEHLVKSYPYSEEDKEGVIIWETPRKCRMQFKELSVEDGYAKTVKMYKRVHLSSRISISIQNGYVVVEF